MDGSRFSRLSLVVSFYLVAIVTETLSDGLQLRIPETLFSSSSLLAGKKVTCDNSAPSSVKFVSETWTCYNMTVDGLRVRYWYIPGFGADKGCSDNTTAYDSKNDIAELCRQMLISHGIEKNLWVAYVNKASCDRSPGKRLIFTSLKDHNKWETFDQGNGYIITLRCATEQ